MNPSASLSISDSQSLPTPSGLMARLSVPRSRYVLLQALVGIGLSYELLFGDDVIVTSTVAHLIVAGLLLIIIGIVLTPSRWLAELWFTNGLVGANTLMAMAIVYVSGNAQGEFYLAFFLLMLVASSVRTLGHMLSLSLVLCFGYAMLLAQGILITGSLSVGQLMGLPVLLMMAIFYGLTLDELAGERQRSETLSHRLAELRFEEEALLLSRDRLMHEVKRLRAKLESTGSTPTPSAREGRPAGPPVRGLPTVSTKDPSTDHDVPHLAAWLSGSLREQVREIGREVGQLRASLARGDEAHKHVDQMLLAGEKLAALGTHLEYWRGTGPMPRQIHSLDRILEHLAPMIRSSLPVSTELLVQADPNTPLVAAEEGTIEQIVLQLVLNSRDAMRDGGCLTIRAGTASTEAARRVAPEQTASFAMLTVADTGIGMTPEQRNRAFNPFHEGGAPRTGRQMGLAMVVRAIKNLGGEVAFESRKGRGTEVTILLPESKPLGNQHRQERTFDPALLAQGTETVLVVMEDEWQRKCAAAALHRVQYQVLEAGSGVEALMVAREHSGGIQLLVSDLAMAEMSGAELAERLLAQRRTMKAIFVSGYPDEVMVRHRIAPRCHVQKPLRTEDLLRRVRAVLDHS
ncbi:MAG: ATP-binding protein [Nitrospiraceae bacterium]